MTALRTDLDRLPAAASSARPRARRRRPAVTALRRLSGAVRTDARSTVANALAWSQQPHAGPDSSVRARRMTAVRGFARYLSGIDPATEVPPLGLLVHHQHWRPPFIYTADDIDDAARRRRRDAVAVARRDLLDPVRAAGRHRNARRGSADARPIRHRLGRKACC